MYSRKAATKWNVKETDLKVLIVFFKKKKQPRQLNALYCSRVLCSIRWLSILFDTSFSFHDDSRSPTVSRCACHRLPSRSRTRQCPAPAKETSRLLPPPPPSADTQHRVGTAAVGLPNFPLLPHEGSVSRRGYGMCTARMYMVTACWSPLGSHA